MTHEEEINELKKKIEILELKKRVKDLEDSLKPSSPSITYPYQPNIPTFGGGSVTVC